ncbi:MAG: hypothetical protein SOR40_01125 [Rothia sp. (in: high G+C Gram-positive bacteria)]|nr:hypothetical protein [Rothia sp. (in: high G+C Gram-positive bacteria)]
MPTLTPTDLALYAAEATPTVLTTLNPDGTFRGSPGILGFAVFFILGVIIILLGLDLTRRSRRLRYRAEYAQAREAEERAAAQAAETNQS